MRPLSTLSVLIWLLSSLVLRGQQDKVAEWNQPFEPFRIIGNVHYVGTNELGVYLVTSPQGHVLIDGGFAETAPLILDSIRALGFKPEDVKALLTTQAHMDHVGSMAGLKAATGAKIMIMEQDVPMMVSGGKGDFAFGDTFMFPPAAVDRVLHDRDVVRVGDIQLTARLTAGHTKGCTTWTMKVNDGAKTRDVVIVGSPNVNPGYKLVRDPSYPGMMEDFEKTFRVLKSLSCDYFLGAHGSYFDLETKYAQWKAGRSTAFIDPEGYKNFLADREQAFQRELKKQKTD